MKIKSLNLLIIALFLCTWSASALAKDISPIVSSDWLEKNLSNPRLVILDIRKVEEYKDGHIPGAVSAYYGVWAYNKEGKRTEIPYQDDLFESIGDAGIRPDSMVVVVCDMSHCFYQVQAARVVCTLEYGGLENVGILDGGFHKWASEKKPIAKDFVQAKKTVYKGKLKRNMLADRNYVQNHLGKAVFVDVRESVLYSGEKKQIFVERAGHLPGSVNLPASEAFTAAGTFKTKSELDSLAEKTVGQDKSKPIIIYCDAGKCCPTWAFIFRDVLGYTNVKLYDGGMEEWSRNPASPMMR